MGGLAVGKIAAELAVFDDVGALRRNAFVVVSEGAESLAMIEAGVCNHIHDARRVFQLVQLIEGQKTCARKIGFPTYDAIQLDGVADGFVDLQAELSAT